MDMIKDVTELKKDVADLTKKTGTLKHAVEVVEESNGLQSTQTADLNARVIELETYSRIQQIIIKGLADGSSAEAATPSGNEEDASMAATDHQQAVMATVLGFLRTVMKIHIDERDITATHRLKGREGEILLIFVRLSSRKKKDKITRARGLLKDYKVARVYMSEDLTKHNSNVFFEAHFSTAEIESNHRGVDIWRFHACEVHSK